MPTMKVKKGDWVDFMLPNYALDSVCAIEDAHMEKLCETDSPIPGWGESWVFRGEDHLGVTILFCWDGNAGCWTVAPDQGIEWSETEDQWV